jgi:hypothetical protein
MVDNSPFLSKQWLVSGRGRDSQIRRMQMNDAPGSL